MADITNSQNNGVVHRSKTGIASVDSTFLPASVTPVPINDIQKELYQVFQGDMLNVGDTVDFVQEFLGNNFERTLGFDVDLRPGQTLNISYELEVLGTLAASEDPNCQATYQTVKGTMDSVKAGGYFTFGIEDCRLCPPGQECGKDLVDLATAASWSQKANMAYLKAKIYAFMTGKSIDGSAVDAKVFAPLSSLGKEVPNITMDNYVAQIQQGMWNIEEAVSNKMFSNNPLDSVQSRSLDNDLRIIASFETIREMQQYPVAELEWLPAQVSKGFGIRLAGYWNGTTPIYAMPQVFVGANIPWRIIDTASLFFKEVCGLEQFFAKGHNSDKPKLTRYYKEVAFISFTLPSLGDYSLFGKKITGVQKTFMAYKTSAVTP